MATKFALVQPGIFGVFSGAKIRPHSQWKLGDFSQFRKKIKSQSSKIYKKKIFLKIFGIFIHTVTTHTSYNLLSLTLISPSIFLWHKVIAKLFLFTKNDIIVHYIEVYRANFPSLIDPRAPSQN